MKSMVAIFACGALFLIGCAPARYGGRDDVVVIEFRPDPTDTSQLGPDPDLCHWLFNGREMGQGPNGFAACLEELGKRPKGGAVVLYPYKPPDFEAGARDLYVAPWKRVDKPYGNFWFRLADATREREMRLFCGSPALGQWRVVEVRMRETLRPIPWSDPEFGEYPEGWVDNPPPGGKQPQG